MRLMQGTAHFKLDWKPRKGGEPASGIVMILGRATLGSAGAECIVRMKSDTREVDVIDRGRPTPDSTAEVVDVIDAKRDPLLLPFS